MNKLFSLFSAVLVALAMQAAQVTQHVWGGSLDLTNDEFQPHNETLFAEGQTLRLTFVKQNDSGWMQVYHKDGSQQSWPGTDLVVGLDLNSGVIELVLNSTAASEIRNYGGLYIKGGNVTLQSIDLVYSTDDESDWEAITVWEGSLTAGHEELSDGTIDASNFTAAKPGHKIRFHFTANDGESYFQMCAITKRSGDWATSHEYMSYAGVTAPSVDITLVEEGFADLQARGLYFQGKHITITKAELLQPKWIAESTWTGDIASVETAIPASYFSKAVAGNKLRFHFTNSEGDYHQLTASTKDANYNYTHYYINYGNVTAPTHDIILDAGEHMSDLIARGLYVSGNSIVISKIELLREDIAIGLIDDSDPTHLLTEREGNIVDFTLNRTLYRDGYFNTLCLPFSLASLAGTPLEGATVMTLVDAEITGTKAGGDMALDVTIDEVSAIEAGKPYLVSFPAGDNITSMTFHDVTITATAPQTVSTTLLDMKGIFAPQNMAADTDNQLFLGDNNTLYWSDGTDPLKGFRAYFQTKSPIAGIPARFARPKNNPTGTEQVQSNSNVQKVFRNGQLIIIRDGKQYNVSGAIVK